MTSSQSARHVDDSDRHAASNKFRSCGNFDSQRSFKAVVSDLSKSTTDSQPISNTSPKTLDSPLKPILIILGICFSLAGILMFVWAVGAPEDPDEAALRILQNYIKKERDIPLFKVTARIESLKSGGSGEIRDWEDVKSKIRVGLEAQGFSITSVKVSETTGSLLNSTTVFECSGKPTKNSIAWRLGNIELATLQFMLNGYLTNQGVYASLVTIQVQAEFLAELSVAMQKVPQLEVVEPIEDNNAFRAAVHISCDATGQDMTSPNVVVRCRPHCHQSNPRHVIGTLCYYIKSSVCLAAIHQGVIRVEKGGLVEFLEIGKGSHFRATFANGIHSASRFVISPQFLVKKPGAGWAYLPPTAATTTLKPLQEQRQLMVEANFLLSELDGANVPYSLSLVEDSKTSIKEKVVMNMKFAFEVVGFNELKIQVASLEQSTKRSAAIVMKTEIYGEYKENALAVFPYKPWEEDETKRLASKVEDYLLHMKVEDFVLKWNKDFVDALTVMPSTTSSPLTKFTGKCGCGDVFFVQSNDSPEKEKIISMYNTLFDTFAFDQVALGLGLALDGDILTEVGEDYPEAILATLKERINMPKSNPTTLWSLLAKLEGDSKFLTQGIGTRKKLLIISTSFVLGPDAANIDIYLDRLKFRGISVAYVGYNWDSKLLEPSFYPESFASEPTVDFVKHVENLNHADKLVSFISDVIRRYICEAPPLACKGLTLAIAPPANLQFKFSVEGIGSSYTSGVPIGNGLKPYTPRGGVYYNGATLPATERFRKTEPDKNQAFYENDYCGQQANSPSFPSSRIVGGSEAAPHSWPWAVSINILRKSSGKYSSNFWSCGGSVLHARWVITAAHCFAKGNQFVYSTTAKVVVGIHNQQQFSSFYGNVYNIQRLVYHPKYDDPRNKFDVVLLYLDRDIPFRREITPVCLPNADVIPAIGRQCWVAGWGYTSNTGETDRSRLKQAVQFIEDPFKCQTVYQRYYYNPNYNICAKRSADSSNVNMQCRGDSGGPLVCRENERWVLYGISNFGPRACESGGESGYFLVSSAMHWICCFVDVASCAYVKCQYPEK